MYKPLSNDRVRISQTIPAHKPREVLEDNFDFTDQFRLRRIITQLYESCFSSPYDCTGPRVGTLRLHGTPPLERPHRHSSHRPRDSRLTLQFLFPPTLPNRNTSIFPNTFGANTRVRFPYDRIMVS